MSNLNDIDVDALYIVSHVCYCCCKILVFLLFCCRQTYAIKSIWSSTSLYRRPDVRTASVTSKHHHTCVVLSWVHRWARTLRRNTTFVVCRFVKMTRFRWVLGYCEMCTFDGQICIYFGVYLCHQMRVHIVMSYYSRPSLCTVWRYWSYCDFYSGGARSLQGPASRQNRTGLPQKVRRTHWAYPARKGERRHCTCRHPSVKGTLQPGMFYFHPI